MDYNYVRMRDARKAGDSALEEYYRNLLKSGAAASDSSRMLNYVIILLAAVALILGAYILLTEITGPSAAEAAAEPAGICALYEGVTA